MGCNLWIDQLLQYLSWKWKVHTQAPAVCRLRPRMGAPYSTSATIAADAVATSMSAGHRPPSSALVGAVGITVTYHVLQRRGIFWRSGSVTSDSATGQGDSSHTAVGRTILHHCLALLVDRTFTVEPGYRHQRESGHSYNQAHAVFMRGLTSLQSTLSILKG